MNDLPDFRSQAFLVDHVRSILDFYEANLLDPDGGFHQNYLDTGEVFDPGRKHLVSSCRMVFNYCQAERLFGDTRYRQYWQTGLQYLRQVHWQNERQGYIWALDHAGPIDETNYCYGMAFVVLAYATALKAGDETARADLYHSWELMEKYFWLPDPGLYADQVSADWQQVANYRGQNANMHACEAMILAFEATGDRQFLDRAYQLASRVTRELSALAGGLIWEHYTENLDIDWQYNREDPKNLYRPWGFQPGHQTEWAKLLLMLHRHRPESWMPEKAAELFDRAVETAWDHTNDGLFYGFDPDGRICDDDKYFWVQAESFAAAALLAKATGEDRYWHWYDRLWQYCWAHFVDHEYGAWYRLLTADNCKTSDRKSEAGAKCDYHNLGACVLVLDTRYGPGNRLK